MHTGVRLVMREGTTRGSVRGERRAAEAPTRACGSSMGVITALHLGARGDVESNNTVRGAARPRTPLAASDAGGARHQAALTIITSPIAPPVTPHAPTAAAGAASSASPAAAATTAASTSASSIAAPGVAVRS